MEYGKVNHFCLQYTEYEYPMGAYFIKTTIMAKATKQESMEATQATECCSGGKKRHSGKCVVIVLLLLSIASSIGSGYYFSKKTFDSYLALEYAKTGGKDNYDLLAKAQQMQLAQQIPQIKEFVNKGATTPTAAATTDTTAKPADTTTPATTDTTSTSKKLSQDEIATIEKTAYLEGGKDATITMIEYSDLECPFCIRQYKDGTIQSTLEKYKGKVNYAYKTFRGVPHENSETEANALLCAGDLGGSEAYVSYYNKIFERSNGGNGTGFSKDNLVPLAKELGLDGKKIQACMDSKKNITRYDAETAEGQKLGVQGTPGTVIINNQTGEYELIAGAYPTSEFDRVITKLLGAK